MMNQQMNNFDLWLRKLEDLQVKATELLDSPLGLPLSRQDVSSELLQGLGDGVKKATTSLSILLETLGSIQDDLRGTTSPLLLPVETRWPLSLPEYKRYGRQLIMPEIGLAGQLRIKKSSILIVGVGGLGCPAATYLAGAGIGTIGLIDGDAVETSNLHRQILHRTSGVGIPKVTSAIQTLKNLNPLVKYVPYTQSLTPQTAIDIFSNYDVIIDCTDHPTSRYLISDAAVLLQKPLVSASALRSEGQMIVLNDPPAPPGSESGGPCYRCIFPRPPPVESIVSCGEGGIIGPVVGVMGVLQALEAIKLVVRDPVLPKSAVAPSLLLFSAFSTPPFRSMKMRGRRKDCVSCSAYATIKKESLSSGSLDYVQFCGVMRSVEILTPDERMEARDFAQHKGQENQILLDVREKAEFELCNLNGSINIPFSQLADIKDIGDLPERVKDTIYPLHVICKLGNDSQIAVRLLKDIGVQGRYVGDITGGFKAWREQVDNTWPEY